jgi:hypothetical protein
MLSQLQAEDDYGVLLLVQVGGAPNELQLMIQTAKYDQAAGGLRPRGQYILRALGVREHKVSVGVFGTLKFEDDHPLLFQYNTTPVAVFFKGAPQDVNELTLDIHQAHASTFGGWRQFPQYMNVGQPLVTLLKSGGGLLGEMPKPLADRLEKVLAHHRLDSKLVEGEATDPEDEHGRSRLHKVLTIDQSYVVALDFSVDEIGKV